MKSAHATPSIALDTHGTIDRTETDIPSEEMTIGTDSSRTCLEDRMQPGNEATQLRQPYDTSSAQNSGEVEDRGLEFSTDYYQFEWFRILIGMVLLIVSEIIIYGLVGLEGIIEKWGDLLMPVAIGLLMSLLYIGIFIVLAEFHEAIGKLLHRYARLRPRIQHICLRFCAYCYAVGAVMGFGFYLFLDLPHEEVDIAIKNILI